ncbi:MAG: tyrosine--tRNA ligase [Clostridiaceae bacterium]|jgi:tyrosyl-tRNA synthetase|nr:tyrosine--tRNA ligase [Clostridiaceae bacterium]
MLSIDEQIRIISKGTEEIIDIAELREKLVRSQKSGKPLTVKLGLDPTAPDIHLGHTVVLRKIRQFQDLGHRAVIIIGDFTGMIGDPTGRSKMRRQLTREDVIENAKTYETQIYKVLDRTKTDLRFNSEWLGKLNFADVISLASKYTVARMLEREDFQKRFSANEPIGIHEFFYPLMQGYDSIEIKADIELGGTEQRFNILMGRKLQKDYGQESQTALFMPVLEGTDGIDKMSKSLGNYIGVSEDAGNMYGKVMSIPDQLIIKYFRLVTDVHPDEVDAMEKMLQSSKVNPRDLKMKLAREITGLYHGADAANQAEEGFVSVFQKKGVPDDIEDFRLSKELCEGGSMDIPGLLVKLGFCPSKSEARRLVAQGAVRINGEKLADFTVAGIKSGDVLQAGKLKFARLVFDE